MSKLHRREFIELTLLSGTGLLASGNEASASSLFDFGPGTMLGGLRSEEGKAPIDGATWYIADNVGDGLSFRFPEGTLEKAAYITADMLLDGNHMIVFGLTLQEGEAGRIFHLRFSGLNQCSFRIRMPMSLVDQNRWGIEREGAFLKPRCSGDRVDLAKVDRMTLTVTRKSSKAARWCMTGIRASETEVARISKPILPKGKLIDELGQSKIHQWEGKSRSAEEVIGRIRSQYEEAKTASFPDSFSRWGGWKERRLIEASGFFRTYHDGRRWWLVDPDGHAFWSTGVDCVRVDTSAEYGGLESALDWLPDPKGEFREIYEIGEGSGSRKTVNYLAANLIRAFGAEGWREKWGQAALGELRHLRFNTVGNWSEWEMARQAKFPYVRPMHFRATRSDNIYRDFPDVFHPDFEKDASDFASQLADTAEDPSFIGYFLMNEPTWGFSSEVPAAGMLYTSDSCRTREQLGRYLKDRYGDSASLSKAWGFATTFEQVAAGKWKRELTDAAQRDLEAFSVLMVERYFKTISGACKAVDPNHLNLGMRWAGLPPKWAVDGMKSFDVFSINCYRDNVPTEVTAELNSLLGMPTLIGEWHFGALDVGLPSSGIGHLKNQTERGKAYRVYMEGAAANPNCVGTHWFTLYDESALGRFDGENYNIGFLDICNRRYPELSAAAIASHERVYQVADLKADPYAQVPEYLPKLY